MVTHQVKYKGVDLLIEGEHTPYHKPSYMHDGYPEHFIIHNVYSGQQLIKLTETELNEIESLVLSQIKKLKQ